MLSLSLDSDRDSDSIKEDDDDCMLASNSRRIEEMMTIPMPYNANNNVVTRITGAIP
jgi:hypothetical protein